MAATITTTSTLSSPPSSPLFFLSSKPSLSLPLFAKKRLTPSLLSLKTSSSPFIAAATSTTKTSSTSVPNDERVKKVHNIAEFDAALQAAKNKLVVVEYAASDNANSQKIYPFMAELSRTCNDVVFLLVMGDESDHTRELCKRQGIDEVPHFTFYKSMEKIHEEDAIGPDQLMGDVLYYGDNHSAVVQLHSRADVEKLIDENRGKDGKMVVLDVGLKHCGPCVKVYPLVIKLSRSMADIVVFARLNGDENEQCMQFLKDMDVVEVPTFLFIKDGEISGRYVRSGKGELIGEILRYQGVRVT